MSSESEVLNSLRSIIEGNAKDGIDPYWTARDIFEYVSEHMTLIEDAIEDRNEVNLP